jgi:hypothetical protein
MTDFDALKTKLAECQVIAHWMSKSGVWDELIHTTAESIDAAVLELDGTYELTSDERSVRARDNANDWRSTQAREERAAA